MAETKTSISELTAATAVAVSDLLFVSQLSGSAYVSKKATVGQLPFGQGTITEIKMNNVSKGTSGVVDLGTVLTAHQSLTGYVSKAELKTALASVGQIPSGDGANLENTIAKFNALFAALSALTD